MAADAEVVKISIKELEEIVSLEDKREAEAKKDAAENEARKKREEERKKKRPSVGIYQPPHRSKRDSDQHSACVKEVKTPSQPSQSSAENWEDDLMQSPATSSKESSIEKEVKTVTSGIQDVKLGTAQQKSSRRSEEGKKQRSRKPEIQRYVPKGRLLEKEGSTDWDDEFSSPSPHSGPSPSPGNDTMPLTPSPRKIDRNLQVTVMNDKAGGSSKEAVENRTSPAVTADTGGNRPMENVGFSRGRGQAHPRGRGQRLNQRSAKQTDSRVGVGNRGKSVESDMKSPVMKTSDQTGKSGKTNNSTPKETVTQKDIKSDQELYIVPSRPSTIGQEADRKDTAPVGTDKNEENTSETADSIDRNTRSDSVPLTDRQALKQFRKSPNKRKSQSFDKLNKAEAWEEEENFYAVPENLGTMVFERSRSSEQLNLSGKSSAKPPMPRSASGNAVRSGGQRVYAGMRRRKDSFSSDVSAGTGSDWSTEELDFDKDLDTGSRIDWNEDVERELALQVQDETQKLNEWFERQELGLSQKDTRKAGTSNAMTTSIPGYESGFLSKATSSEMTPEKSNTLPFTRRKHQQQPPPQSQEPEPRGRQAGRRGSLGFRSRDSSVSSVQSVHSVQSAYSGDGRRRRRRRRKSSGGSQKMMGGSRGNSMEQLNIQVTCGGQGGGRREVKMDEYSRRGHMGSGYQRQNSSEGRGRGGQRGDQWRDRNYRGDQSRGRGSDRQYSGDRGRGYDNRGSHEHLDDQYYSKDRWHRDDRFDRYGRPWDDRQSSQHNSQNPQHRGKRDRPRHDSGGHQGSGQGGQGHRRNDQNFDHRDDGRAHYRDKDKIDRRRGPRHDSGGHERDGGDFQRGHHRDNRSNRGGDRHRDNRQENYHDNEQNDREAQQNQPRGGILHLPSQNQPQSTTDQNQQQNPRPGPHNNWSRGHTPEQTTVQTGRERQHSGGGAGGRQRTLYDPNNPSKPIVIDDPRPQMEFKDTDGYGISPQSPQQYPGAMPPVPPEMYARGPAGYGQFYPPGYGYGYGMPPNVGPHPNPMMPAPPGVFYGFPGPMPPGQMRGGPEDMYYQGGMDGENQAIRGRSQNTNMAEHLFRESMAIDKQLSSLMSRRIGGEDTLHAIYQYRRDLMVRCERIILLDPALANDRNVEQMLWKSVFYQMVELIRKQLADDHQEETKVSLYKILDEGTVFYESLLDKLQKTFGFDLEVVLNPDILPPDNLGRHIKLALLSTQKTLICLGDIARYKEQNNDGGKVNYAKARNFYTKAQLIAPKNGRPYNQLAILALYTKHKLDAVYYYMRSLAASNPFLTARESLVSLFNEARKKAEASEQQRYEEKKKRESLRPKHAGKPVQEHRIEIWINPHDGTSLKADVDDNAPEDLAKLDAIQLNKRFVLSYLNVHGKLFTKIGMEMFADICGQMLHEFRALLKNNAIGPQRLLQLMAINMFAVENTALKDESLESTCKSLLQQHSVQMGLDMFGILLERCTMLLENHIHSSDYPGRMFSRELEELIPGVKVWTDWMICHTDLWNPPPQVRDPLCGPQIDVWAFTATLYNILMEMDTSDIAKFYTERKDGYEAVILPEDSMLSGFVPLLGKANINTFIDSDVDKEMAKDCLRVEKLRVFGAYLYGMEQPMLAYSGQTKKYYSVAPSDGYEETDAQQPSADVEDEEEIVIEEEEIVQLEESGADDAHVQELRARKEELERRMNEKRRIHEHRQHVLETNRHQCIEIEIRPIFLVPDTNCFIDHLPSLRKLVSDRQFTVVIPLVVINELDGLAQGSLQGKFDSEDHARKVKTRAQHTISYLEQEFEQKNTRLKALTSKGTVMETISFRSEETDSSGNNDDLILSCCMYYCKDKARDFMPKDKDTPVHLMRDVVLLTEDRNLRLKAHTHNVPVKDVPGFIKWSSGSTQPS